MPVNHSWKFSVSCPGCGKRGEIKVTEHGGPPFSDPPPREYASADGFRVVVDGEASVECGACGASFPSRY
jgi:hypothetical protein